MKNVNKEKWAMIIGVVVIIICMIATGLKISEKSVPKYVVKSHMYKNENVAQLQMRCKFTSLEGTGYETEYEYVENDTIIQIVHGDEQLASYSIKQVKYWLNDNFFVTEDNILGYIYFMRQDGKPVVKVEEIGEIEASAGGACLKESETFWPIFEKEGNLYVPVPNDWQTVETYSFSPVFKVKKEVANPDFGFEIMPIKELITEQYQRANRIDDVTHHVYTEARLNLNGKEAIIYLK